MKKDEVKVGATYMAKVNGGVVPVKITGEKWTGEKHTGWIGVNTKTNRSVRIKSAQRLRAEAGGEAEAPPAAAAGNEKPAKAAPGSGGVKNAAKGNARAGAKQKAGGERGAQAGEAADAADTTTGEPKAAKAPRAEKAPKPAKPKRVSALDAAAIVLAAAGAPMKPKEMIATMEAKGLWASPGGKTPEATLYAAIIREIAAKGREARFRKTERGTFVATEHAITTSANADAANV